MAGAVRRGRSVVVAAWLVEAKQSVVESTSSSSSCSGYALSAREPGGPGTWFDRLQRVMLVTGVVLDVIVLVAVAGRIGAYGLTANKAAALGLNLVLLVNLLVSAVLQGRFAGGRIGLVPLQRWQTGYLPVFFLWAAAVVLLLPPAFGFS